MIWLVLHIWPSAYGDREPVRVSVMPEAWRDRDTAEARAVALDARAPVGHRYTTALLELDAAELTDLLRRVNQ